VNRYKLRCLAVGTLCLNLELAFAQQTPSTIDDRAEAIVSQMTREEQFSLLSSLFPVFQRDLLPADGLISAGYIPGVERLGYPSLRKSDAGLGVANLMNWRKGALARRGERRPNSPVLLCFER